MRTLVRPHGVLRSGTANGNAVVAAIALVRTVAVMRCPNEVRHVRIVARQIVNRWVSLLLQPERSRRFSNDPPGHLHTHLAPSWRNRDGMVRPGNSDLLRVAQLGIHLCSSCCQLQLRAAIDWNARACDPACLVRSQERDYVSNILGLADTLQCLHSQRGLTARFSLRETRHICVDYAWRNSVNAYAARPENGLPVLDQRLKCSFGRAVSKKGRIFQTGLARHRTGSKG